MPGDKPDEKETPKPQAAAAAQVTETCTVSSGSTTASLAATPPQPVTAVVVTPVVAAQPPQKSTSVPPRVVSFRAQARGEISDFLTKEGITCAHTIDAVAGIASSLCHYREEGVSLRPNVILCDDLTRFKQLVAASDAIQMGSGTLNLGTAIRSLKECAPLARGDWYMFLHRQPPNAVFGVIDTGGVTPLAVRPLDLLLGGGTSMPPTILIHQTADNTVELAGSRGGRLILYYSNADATEPSGDTPLREVAEAMAETVEPSDRFETTRFWSRVLSDALPVSHGALIAVVRPGTTALFDEFSDSTRLSPPLRIEERLRDFSLQRTAETLARAQSARELFTGMLNSDGIIVTDTSSNVLAYRAFIKSPGANAPGDGRPVGGARRRAFARLCELRYASGLHAAFMYSSDGNSMIKRITE